MPFGKNDHCPVIEMIAKGMHDAGFNKTYLEVGLRAGSTFARVAPYFTVAVGVEADSTHFATCSDLRIPNAQLQLMKSDFFFEHLDNVRFNLIFIDANHHFDYVRRDFDNAFKVVEDGGLILLHDTFPPSAEVCDENGYCNDCYKIGDHIKKHYVSKGIAEFSTLPFYYGIGIVRKTDRQLTWRKAG